MLSQVRLGEVWRLPKSAGYILVNAGHGNIVGSRHCMPISSIEAVNHTHRPLDAVVSARCGRAAPDAPTKGYTSTRSRRRTARRRPASGCADHHAVRLGMWSAVERSASTSPPARRSRKPSHSTPEKPRHIAPKRAPRRGDRGFCRNCASRLDRVFSTF